MYPLTIGLAIENKLLWDQAQAALAELPFRIIVEHQDVGDVTNFLDRLERMRPDVVLLAATDADFAPLRENARFKELVKE